MSRNTPKDTKSFLPRRSGDPDLVHGRPQVWERKYERADAELLRGVAL